MKKIKKIFYFLLGNLIKTINYFSPSRYMKLYNKYLLKLGIDISPEGATHIEPSAYLDGTDYSKIHIGKRVVISRNVTLLTHDLSLQRIFYKLQYEGKHLCGYLEDIEIGDNSFIGANAVLLPGTKIGKNSIVGAGAVVKGNYKDNVIIIGCPAKVIADSLEWGKRKFDEKEYKYF